MNRNAFLKKCMAFVGIATATAAVTTLKSDVPTLPIDSLIKTNKLHITDGKSTYELIVENNSLQIRKVKTEKEKLAEELKRSHIPSSGISGITSCYSEQTSFIFKL
jgi:hypothetical protein